MVVVTEKNSNVKPITNFRGSAVWKFSYSDGDERIERNMTTEVKGESMKFGRPEGSLLPGTV